MVKLVKMKEQEVYIKVSVESIKDLPEKNGRYMTDLGHIEFNIDENNWVRCVCWYLKPITAIVLTPEDLFYFSDYISKNFYKVFLEETYYQRSGGTVWNGGKFTRQEIIKIYLQSKEDKPTR